MRQVIPAESCLYPYREAASWILEQFDRDARDNTPCGSPTATDRPPKVSVALPACLHDLARCSH